MLTKIEIVNLVNEKNLSEKSLLYVKHILRNFEEKEIVSEEKIIAIKKILSLEQS
ncbi:hypothetical protein KKD37_02930 [Patescibacteria group bacterium]|nr:hypothetical protein [Patescibacteria group bacterium]